MKTHSSSPIKNDKLIVSYLTKKTLVNMPIKNFNQVKLFKEPIFKVIGVWKKK